SAARIRLHHRNYSRKSNIKERNLEVMKNILRRCLPFQALLPPRELGPAYAIPSYLRRNVRGSRGRAVTTEIDPEEPLSYGAAESDRTTQAEDVLNRPRGRRSVKKFLHNSATFQETSAQVPQFSDPFISGPYAQGTTVPSEVKAELKEDHEEDVRKLDPKTRTVIQFPGDGTQYLKMCGDPAKFPKHISVLYDIASGILGYDLVDLIMNGPAEKLDQTRYSQPAVLVSSLAALELLRDFDPPAVENCAASAGFGVGEISSLVLAGVLDFEDAVRFVKYRGEAMELAGEMVQSGMSLVIYGADSQLGPAMKYAEEWCKRQYRIENPVCSVAHYLFPHCKIIAGNVQALEFIEMNYKDFKLRKIKRLPARAAYHTELMQPAAEPLRHYLNNVTLNPSRISIYSNATGFNYFNEKQIRTNIVKQVYMPIKWEQILHAIYARSPKEGFPHSYECGPGKSLGQVFRMVNRKAYQQFNVVPPDFKLMPEPVEKVNQS
ncbi:unnamed protein product, partial [Allacma fusca]